MPYLESIRVFTRTIELGSITAGGRDNRLTPAVASNRIKELEERLGVRLFNRTTRKLTPTEVGRAYYDAAKRVLEAIEEAEAAVASFSLRPRGALKVTAPLGLGRRVVAALIPAFHAEYPEVEIRLRLSDRKVDYLEEAVDVAFVLGELEDSTMKLRTIADCERVLCAAPAYLAERGTPETPNDLVAHGHTCLLLRFPGSREYFWTFATHDGPLKLNVRGAFDADDGQVLTDWAAAARHPAAALALRLPLPAPPAAGPEGAGLHPLDGRALPRPPERDARRNGQRGPDGTALTTIPDPFTRNTQSIRIPYAFHTQEVAVNLCFPAS
jgi:DNA-binding transcriptional LysR family regulator